MAHSFVEYSSQYSPELDFSRTAAASFCQSIWRCYYTFYPGGPLVVGRTIEVHTKDTVSESHSLSLPVIHLKQHNNVKFSWSVRLFLFTIIQKD